MAYILLVNGYQTGTDPQQFDHRIGCSAQTFASRAEAARAWKELQAMGARGRVEIVEAA